MQYLTLSLQVLVGTIFLVIGVGTIGGFRKASSEPGNPRTGRAPRLLIGLLEFIGGIATLVSIFQPFLAFFASALLVLVTVAKQAFPVARGRKRSLLGIGLLFVATLSVAALQPLGLKVLLLPAADALSLEKAPSAQELKTYDKGFWLEGVAAGPDGTLYLSGNKGEDYATGNKSHVHAQVIARAPNGTESVFFTLPKGTTAGVMAFDAGGNMYMTSQGSELGVWRLTGMGTGELITRLPAGSWPNGLAFGPDGQLYVADSSLGTIWRVDPNSGVSERAIESDALRARPYVALAPGANGIEFFGHGLYVTVSDAARILKFELSRNGEFSSPAVVADGIPGDDLAIDVDGTLYVTTHPFNTVVKVAPDGRRSLVANASHGVAGATDAAFGTFTRDRDMLYVVTDGGAFTGDKDARGSLVGLKLR